MSSKEDITIKELKELESSSLEGVAEELRSDMIYAVAKNGGHLASSLGTVELTLALHRVFDAPKDKIVWDVGHQAYAHKMLTGRRSEMQTLRQHGGISGFPKISESEFDTSSPGHCGTSLSIACGYAKARDIRGENYTCVAVIGDGSMTSGVAWEALNFIGESKTPLIIVLNDNQMSISRNIGGISKHFHNLRTSVFYKKFKTNLKKVKGEKSKNMLRSIRDAIKYSFIPRDIFDEIGIKYYGPIDGHDTKRLEKMFAFAKTLNRPVLIHVITTKGKGFKPAEDNPTKYHGIGCFDPSKAEETQSAGAKTWSDAFGDVLLKYAKEDERICAITAAMGDSTGLSGIEKEFPDRYFDVAIAEQHATAFAEGLALAGMRPVAAIYSTFLQRAYDQLLTEVCLQKLPVIFGVDRAGVTGSDGETHQGIYDIAYLYTMPGITVYSPRDEATLDAVFAKALALGAPAAIRYPRGKVSDTGFASGDGSPQILKDGKDVLIISDGNMLSEALGAAKLLEKEVSGINVALADIGTLKPLDEAFLAQAFKNYKYIVTIEDGVMHGGFGTAVLELASKDNEQPSVLNIGWPDAYIEHGSVAELRKAYKMDAEGIASRIKDGFGGRF